MLLLRTPTFPSKAMEIEYAEKIIDIESIFAMREILIDDLGKAAARLDAAKEPIAILNHQECGPFDYYIVISGDKFYEVTRLNFFAQCTCKAFTDGHSICKHIAATLPPICRTCFKREAPTLGGQCQLCGPGSMMSLHTRFQLPKYFNKSSVFEVVAITGDKAICHDMTQPVSAKCPTRDNVLFPLAALDLYRQEGSLQIVESQDLFLEN